MKLCLPLISLLLAAGLTVPAAAQVIVVGDTGAAACYRHAAAGRTTRDALDDCTRGTMESTSRRNISASYVNRAIVLINRKEFTEALADVEQSFRYRDFPEAYATRGVIYFHMDRFQDSIEQATLALADPSLKEPAKVYYNRALAYERLDRIEEAYYDYLAASQSDPRWRLPRQELERFTVLPANEAF